MTNDANLIGQKHQFAEENGQAKCERN